MTDGIEYIAAPAAAGGASDHGDLTGLGDDDHPQYETSAEAAAKVTAHEVAADPHPTYETSAEAAAKVSTHAGLADPHTGYVLESLVDAKGDLIAASAADTVARLAVGADGTVLKAASGQATGLQWAAETAHPNLATHDSLGLATDAELTTHAGAADPHTGYVLESLYDAKGDLISASADNTPAKLTVGANGTVLTAASGQATGLQWTAPTAETLPVTLLDAKGDLIAATAADTAARLAVGSNGQRLEADSAQATGLKWTSTTTLLPVTAPAAPATGVTLYVDTADSKLKAVKASGDIIVVG